VERYFEFSFYHFDEQERLRNLSQEISRFNVTLVMASQEGIHFTGI